MFDRLRMMMSSLDDYNLIRGVVTYFNYYVVSIQGIEGNENVLTRFTFYDFFSGYIYF